MLRAPHGLCETCDLVRVAGTQEANETRPRFFMPMVHHAEPVRHLAPMSPPEEPAAPPASSNGAAHARYQKGPERGKCSTCGHTRAEHLAEKKSAAPAAPKRRGVGAAMTIEQLRSQWSDEREDLLRQVAALETRLEVLDDVEKAIQAGQ